MLTRAGFDGLLARIQEPCFRDVLEFCWETGCRVQEVRRIEACHVRLDRHRVELPPAEAKGKKRWRFISMTPAAEAIVVRLLGTYASGLLFLNADGNPWGAQNFNNRFCRLQATLGREELVRRKWALDPVEVEKLAATLPPTRRENGRTVTGSRCRSSSRIARRR
ncbi:MAG TPA: tyrosine-type recombinase/integrase [Gemmata sp.]